MRGKDALQAWGVSPKGKQILLQVGSTKTVVFPPPPGELESVPEPLLKTNP